MTVLQEKRDAALQLCTRTNAATKKAEQLLLHYVTAALLHKYCAKRKIAL
jgi:hypothetical protein